MRLLVTLACALLMTACSTIAPRTTVSLDELDGYIASDRFSYALQRIDNIPQTHPDYKAFKKRRQEIVQAALRYEKKILKQSHKLRKEGNWPDAILVLERALRKNPDRMQLQQDLNEARAIQTHKIKDLELEQLINRTRAKQSELKIGRELLKLRRPALFGGINIEGLENDLKRLGTRLGLEGLTALARGEQRLGHEALSLANQLAPTVEVKAALTKIEARIKRRQQGLSAKKRQARIKKQEKQAREKRLQVEKLIHDGRDTLKQGHLNQSKEKLKQAAVLAPRSPAVAAFSADLKHAIDQRVLQLLAEGNSAYRASHYAEAKQQWLKILILQPGHARATTSLERVKRVLNKVDQLQTEQAVNH